jgi:hypothetical protein
MNAAKPRKIPKPGAKSREHLDREEPRRASQSQQENERTTKLLPRLRLPGKNWRLSKFGSEMGALLGFV